MGNLFSHVYSTITNFSKHFKIYHAAVYLSRMMCYSVIFASGLNSKEKKDFYVYNPPSLSFYNFFCIQHVLNILLLPKRIYCNS